VKITNMTISDVISSHGDVAVNPKASTLNTEDQVTVRQLARNISGMGSHE